MARGKVKSMERDFWFDLNPSNENGVLNFTSYVDLAQIASLVNRVSLRQGMEYVVESMEVITNGSGTLQIFRLPEHWPLLNSWEKTFRHWDEQQREAAEDAGVESTIGAYHDFKVFFDADHANAGSGANLIPVGYTTTSPATGGYDWSPSQVVVPNEGGPGVSVEYYLHALGADNAGANPSKGMVLAYAESRSRPFNADPNIVNVPVGGLFGEMEDVGEDMGDIIGNFQDGNNEPPYVIDVDTVNEFYPGGVNQGTLPLWGGISQKGQLEDVLNVRGGTSGLGTDTAGGFVAPCGLIKLVGDMQVTAVAMPWQEEAVPSALLRITVAPGSYKGLLAQSMQEAN